MSATTNNLRGYGNIYTPHAGSMIIQVQRENGLANRTIVLSTRQVRILRFFMSRTGITVAAIILGSWGLLAVQAARVPILTQQLAHMEHAAARIDTLGVALSQLQRRYAQVQIMLGAAHRPDATAAITPTDPASAAPATPSTTSPDAAAASSPAKTATQPDTTTDVTE